MQGIGFADLIKFHISGVMKLCVVVAPQKRVVSQSLYLVHKYKHKYKYKCKHDLSPFSQEGYFLHQSNILHISVHQNKLSGWKTHHSSRFY